MFTKKIFIGIGMMMLTATLAAGPRSPKATGPAKTLEGAIVSIGSDTMRPLLQHWSEKFHNLNPGVDFSIEARGSGTAAKALAEGRSQVAPMSRPMEASEVMAFGERFGYAPTGIRVARDAVAVYVHPDNPIKGLTIEQLDGIFSSGQRCGGKHIGNWSEIIKNGRNEPIKIVGRDKLSGTHDFFRAIALCKGDFANNYEAMPDSSHVPWKVAQTPTAIGYAGVGYITSKVKLVPIAKQAGEPFVPIVEDGAGPNSPPEDRFAGVISGEYPLSRYLFIYVNKPPGKRLTPHVEAFVKFVLSKEGRDTVAVDGFIPLNEKQASEQAKRLESSFLRPWWGQD